MPDRTYHIVTFGCQMNDADSGMMAGVLEAKGLRACANEDDADLLVFNTCVVRQGAEDRALARLQRLKSIKKNRSSMIVGVCGCLAQKDGWQLIERMPWVDFVLGTRAIARLSTVLDEIDSSGAPQVWTELEGDPYEGLAEPQLQGGLIGRVNIIYGCDKKCAYCIVPRARGRELSRPSEAVLADVRAFAAQGAKEILLIGQNVNSYRDGKTNLAQLMKEVDAVEGVERIRVITSHPRDAGEAQFRAMAELPKVCEALHLPAQSGSTRILKLMRRGYTREHYLKKIELLRLFVPDVTLNTDLMVGFPGETEEDFEETLSLAREIRFDSAFMFMYSPREGTESAQWPDDVPLEVKKARLARLIELQEAIGAECNRACENRRFEVLVERPARKSPGSMAARTRGDKTVVFPGAEDLIGQTVEVEIVSSNAHTLIGRMVAHSPA